MYSLLLIVILGKVASRDCHSRECRSRGGRSRNGRSRNGRSRAVGVSDHHVHKLTLLTCLSTG
jgi:hypothetical protein